MNLRNSANCAPATKKQKRPALGAGFFILVIEAEFDPARECLYFLMM
jgi:hypothetical protein